MALQEDLSHIGLDTVPSTPQQGVEVPEELRREVESALQTVDAPSQPTITRRVEPPIKRPDPFTRTRFEELSPKGQEIISTQRAVLNEMKATIVGHREVVSPGVPTRLDIFVKDDRTDAFIGGRLQKNEKGEIETVWSVPLVGTAASHTRRPIRR